MSVLERLREAAPGVLDEEPVLFAYLFGSHATGAAHPRSDVDVAVMLEEHVPEAERLETGLRLARRLAEASGLGRIEVVALNDAPLPLVGRAISTREVIYSKDEPARVEFESRRHREFLDFQIHAEPLARASCGARRATADGRRRPRAGPLGETPGGDRGAGQAEGHRYPPGDETALAAAKYRFIVAIETCIDVAEHVISDRRSLPAPTGVFS